MTSFMKLHELRATYLELLCEKKSTQHRQHSEKGCTLFIYLSNNAISSIGGHV